ncbi:MAG: DUF1987 domain-containing protein [Pseudomonadota bacterium]
MNNLKIAASKDTLGIDCDINTGQINIDGNSYPMDPAEFFSPVFSWLDQYIKEVSAEVILNLHVNYLNSSSTKSLFDLIDRLEEYHEGGGKAQINWYFKEDDKDIHETGKEFQDDMELPFELISY